MGESERRPIWIPPSQNEVVLGDWEHIFQPGYPAELLKLTERDLDRKGNVLTFGPVAQEYSEIEALLLVLVAAKLLKTPEGTKQLVDLIKTYITQAAQVIASLQKSSAGNVYTAIFNQFVSCKIYARMGLMTSFDALQTEVWLDHQVGEILKRDYVQQAMVGLTTLVDATSYKEDKTEYAGLATLAKVLGKP